MTGAVWAAVAAVGFGVFQSINRRAVRDMDVYVSTFLQLLLSSLVLAVISAVTLDLHVLQTAPPAALASFGLAGFFHFFAGWTFLNASQKRIGAARTSPLVGTTPLFGTAVAAIVLRELPPALALVGVVLTVGGVYVISLRPASARGAAPAAAMGGAPAPAMGGAPAAAAPTPVLALACALCWSISPVFTRIGLRGLPSPLLGVTVGLTVSAAVYCMVLFWRGGRAGRVSSREALAFKIVAGLLVGLTTWARWVALDLAPVSVVLALATLSVPTVIMLAPLLAGQQWEQVTPTVWLGAALIVSGSLLLVYVV